MHHARLHRRSGGILPRNHHLKHKFCCSRSHQRSCIYHRDSIGRRWHIQPHGSTAAVFTAAAALQYHSTHIHRRSHIYRCGRMYTTAIIFIAMAVFTAAVVFAVPTVFADAFVFTTAAVNTSVAVLSIPAFRVSVSRLRNAQWSLNISRQ